jgi:hypothetical protein
MFLRGLARTPDAPKSLGRDRLDSSGAVEPSGLLRCVLERAAGLTSRAVEAIADLERRVIQADGGRLTPGGRRAKRLVGAVEGSYLGGRPGEDATCEGFPAGGEASQRHAASAQLVEDDLGSERCEQRLGGVFGVEVRSGLADEGDDVGVARRVYAAQATAEPAVALSPIDERHVRSQFLGRYLGSARPQPTRAAAFGPLAQAATSPGPLARRVLNPNGPATD